MTPADLIQLYKAWKDVKGSIKKVTGSGSYKILQLSAQVDDLVKKYAAWKRAPVATEKALAEIRQGVRSVKDSLFQLANKVPSLPKFGKRVAVDLAANLLEAANTAKMAQDELMRIAMEQFTDALPADEIDNWPARRGRLLEGAKAFSRQAVALRQAARALEKEIEGARNEQDGLREVKDFVPRDELDELDGVYQDWVKVEQERRDDQRRISQWAAAFEKAAENSIRLVEAGDLTHRLRQQKK